MPKEATRKAFWDILPKSGVPGALPRRAAGTRKRKDESGNGPLLQHSEEVSRAVGDVGEPSGIVH
jgi:hypothetical protein